MTIQVTVGGNNLDNGSWRRIIGDWVDGSDASGGRTVVVTFIIEADSNSDMASRVSSTRTDFDTNGKRIQLTVGGSDLADLNPGDGTTIDTTTYIDDAGAAKAQFGIIYRLVCVAEKVIPDAPQINNADVEGLETFQVLHTYNSAGRLSTRTVSGAFVGTNVGDGRANYNSAFDDICTNLLKTAAGGAWDATNKYVLVDQVLDNPDGEDKRLEFVLASSYRALAMTTSSTNARHSALRAEQSQPTEWHQDAGAVPTFITVNGSVSLDISAVDSSGIKALWEGGVRADVRSFAQSEGGGQDVGVLSERYSYDLNDGVLQVNCTYQVGNTDVLRFDRVHTITETEDDAIIGDAAGNHHVQRAPTSPDIRHTISATKWSTSPASPSSLVVEPTPVAQGRRMHRLAFVPTLSGPYTTEFGQVFKASVQAEYIELKNNQTQAPPVTQ